MVKYFSEIYTSCFVHVVFIVILSTSACSTFQHHDEAAEETHGKSRGQFETTDSESYVDSVSVFYEKNAELLKVAKLVSRNNVFSTFYDVQSITLQKDAHKQGLFPQIRPVTSLTDNGDAVARILVEQTIWDNGRYKAGKKVLVASKERAVAIYRTQANERIAQSIDAYLQYTKYQKLITLTNELEEIYRKLKKMAAERVQGGVGTRAEHNLFELKLLQIEAEKEDYTAKLQQSQSELLTLWGAAPEAVFSNSPSFDITVPLFEEADMVLFPSLAEIFAEVRKQKAELAKEKALRRPELRVSASAGDGTSLGLGLDDQVNNATLGFSYSKPLYWGANKLVEALEQSVLASEAKLAEKMRDTGIQLSTLQQRHDFLITALPERLRISNLAQERVDNFQQDFRAGASTMLEAINILETTKSLSIQYIETSYEFEAVKLEQAKIQGLLGPVEGLSFIDASNNSKS